MEEKSLFHNFIFNFIKTLNNILFPVITFTYSARILGVDGVGQVNFTKSIITYFTMVATLGMNYYGTREAAKRRGNRDKLSKYTHEMLFINCVTTALAYVLLFLSMALVPKLQDYRALLLVNSLAIALQGMGMEWLYQALEEYRYIAVRSSLFQVAALVAMFVFVRDAEDVAPYAAVTLAASSGAYVLNFINARKYICWRWYGHYEIKKHLRPILWLFAMAVSIELYTVLDSTMLGFLQGDAAVGRYTAAVKVNKLVNSLIIAIGAVLIPRLSFYIGQGEQERVKALVEKAYNYVFMLSVPAAVGLFMLSDGIIRLFSGPEFMSASLTMRILTPIVILIPFSVMTNQQTFVPMGKEKLILFSTSVGAVTNIILNSFLIPRYAENGAAIATVIAEMAVAIICLMNVSRYFDMKQVLCSVGHYWIAAAVIPVVVLLIKMMDVSYIVHIILAIPVSVMLYYIILLLLKNPYAKGAFQIVDMKFSSGRSKKYR